MAAAPSVCLAILDWLYFSHGSGLTIQTEHGSSRIHDFPLVFPDLELEATVDGYTGSCGDHCAATWWGLCRIFAALNAGKRWFGCGIHAFYMLCCVDVLLSRKQVSVGRSVCWVGL